MNKKNTGNGTDGKCNFSHFTMEQRNEILRMLRDGSRQESIANALSVSKSSISRELLRNRTFVKNNSYKRNFCTKAPDCKMKSLCPNMDCQGLCKNCKYGKKCNGFCREYVPLTCKRLTRFPYVCDGCSKAGGCTLDHFHYYPREANKRATERLVQTRVGINITEEQLAEIDRATVSGCERKQSIEHIFSDKSVPVTTRTIRNYINRGILTTVKDDLPRGAICKPRNAKQSKETQQQIRKAKQGRDLSAFLAYAQSHQFLFFTELDTVERSSRSDDKARLLTLILVRTHLFLCYRIPNGNQSSVEKIFNDLYATLGHDDFVFLFDCILTDNGAEFSNPESIEFDKFTGRQRSHIFYCHPYASWEKGAIEVCHELLRRIVPKGTSLGKISHEKTRRICSHINSYYRPNSEKCAFDIFTDAFGERGISILNKLGIVRIDNHDVNLSPSLLID